MAYAADVLLKFCAQETEGHAGTDKFEPAQHHLQSNERVRQCLYS